jgi:hypothetical protein
MKEPVYCGLFLRLFFLCGRAPSLREALLLGLPWAIAEGSGWTALANQPTCHFGLKQLPPSFTQAVQF